VGLEITGKVTLAVRDTSFRWIEAKHFAIEKAAQHECGWILDEFRELISIRRETAELSLIVMGID
jgi:hypothetical protein